MYLSKLPNLNLGFRIQQHLLLGRVRSNTPVARSIIKRSITSNTANKEKPDTLNLTTSTFSAPNVSLYNDVVPKIGLEVHAQLKLSSKLFSHGGTSTQAISNSQLDLFDLALPGSLPVLNRDALEAAILTSLGLNCTIQDVIHFDRKNYFYTDMPAGFQITQYNKPIAKNGFIDFIVTTYHKSLIAHSQQYDLVKYLYQENRKDVDDFEPYMKRSRIMQVQLEQDSAKTLHQESDKDTESDVCNLIDYNRSGSALIEIVFEPDLTNHHEASSLIKELITILEALKTCDCELQEGSLRVDANVSIFSIANQVLDNSCRVELKNLNSLKSLNRGIFHEIHRQADLIKSGQQVIQETRTFDTKKAKTVPLRIKEDALDYRYVPEPNIPLLKIEKELVDIVHKERFPSETPSSIRESLLSEFDLELSIVAELLEEPHLSAYFMCIMKDRSHYNPNVIADFLIYTIANLKELSSSSGLSLRVDLTKDSDFLKRLSPEKVRNILDLMLENKISFTTAYEVIKHIYVSKDLSEPKDIVSRFNWYQINDVSEIDELVALSLKKMKNISKRYKRDGEKRHLRQILDRLCADTENKISVKGAIDSINKHLRPSSSDAK